jgi:electron transfer flavoprotein alpha subunit
MKNINISHDLCIGCGLCVQQCPYDAIIMDGDIARIDENCVLCGYCVPVCPVSAIIMDVSCVNNIDKDVWKGILVYVQTVKSGFHAVSLEMLKLAQDLSKIIDEKVYLVCIGSEQDISEFNGHTFERIFVYDDQSLQTFRVDKYNSVLIDCINKIKPSTILFGATLETRVLAPYVAVNYNTGVTADCTKVQINESGDLLQVRPAYGGNVMAMILTDHTRPQITTVRPHKQPNNKPSVEYCVFDDSQNESKIQIISHCNRKEEVDISQERIIVAIGRGVKEKNDIEIFREFAVIIGGSLACSRSLVEKGWMHGNYQIGLSGKAVRPDLLITLGVSGSIQFQAGIKAAKEIVAINIDPDAPIMSLANWSVIGDMYEFIPKLIRYFKS